MHQPSIIEDNWVEDLELHSFKSQLRNTELKKEYLDWLNDKKNIEAIGSKHMTETYFNKEYIDESFERFTTKECHGFFIYNRINKDYIGTVKLDKINKQNLTAEDGIIIGRPENQRKGYGLKTYFLLVNYGFKQLGLRKIMGGCNELNDGMRRLFGKIGYKEEGKFRKTDWIKGEWFDHIYFGIFKDEFESNKSNIYMLLSHMRHYQKR